MDVQVLAKLGYLRRTDVTQTSGLVSLERIPNESRSRRDKKEKEKKRKAKKDLSKATRQSTVAHSADKYMLVSSVQHPRQKWKRRKKYDCEREREEEENFQLYSVHLWLKLEFFIGLN